MKHLILASLSPRRAELLKQAGYRFKVHGSDIVNEVITETLPMGVELLALQKAENVAHAYNSGIVIGADTVVVKDSEIMGKPVDDTDAARMLKKLSGTEHSVITAVAFVDAAGEYKTVTDHALTTVRMHTLTEDEIKQYIKSGEHADKAGAYGIQCRAAVFVERIEGCYFNVVGLPLSLVYRHLTTLGIEPDFGMDTEKS